MYEVVKAYIQAGGYDLTALLTKIDTLWVQGSLSDDQRTQLRSLAQGGATLGGSTDILVKLQEHDQSIRALQEAVAALQQGSTDESTGNTVEEYVPGKWYYNGDQAAVDGVVYICTAPEGVVCTWSPAEYPPYWQEVTA